MAQSKMRAIVWDSNIEIQEVEMAVPKYGADVTTFLSNVITAFPRGANKSDFRKSNVASLLSS